MPTLSFVIGDGDLSRANTVVSVTQGVVIMDVKQIAGGQLALWQQPIVDIPSIRESENCRIKYAMKT